MYKRTTKLKNMLNIKNNKNNKKGRVLGSNLQNIRCRGYKKFIKNVSKKNSLIKMGLIKYFDNGTSNELWSTYFPSHVNKYKYASLVQKTEITRQIYFWRGNDRTLFSTLAPSLRLTLTFL